MEKWLRTETLRFGIANGWFCGLYIGMKIFGEGKHVSDAERERSIRFAVTESNLHCMTLGLESIAQMNDAIERVMRNARG